MRKKKKSNPITGGFVFFVNNPSKAYKELVKISRKSPVNFISAVNENSGRP